MDLFPIKLTVTNATPLLLAILAVVMLVLNLALMVVVAAALAYGAAKGWHYA